ncbi:leucine--tRNA ligase [Candidatus Micrarchaeota archaeon]|nr:leucine--tRNA ligase [Candidatus Micrarchaeota archaeon]
MDSNAIEKKWSGRWAEKAAFQPDPDPGREKRYITAAFPYPNSPPHIGHGRTYTTADIYARYLRLKGYNVLFPMAFHVTGTPILAMAKHIAAKDPDVLGIFDRIYGIPPEKAATLSEPRTLVAYFSDEIEKAMKEIGYSIDWRRKFYSYDAKFNLFIQWQFRKLKELGYLIKGEYPIAWCPADKNAVSAHDTRGDVDPEVEDVTVIKFPVPGSPLSLVATTYRPETLYGVTNIWVNPKAKYVKARYKGETIILAEKAAQVLDLQLGLEITGEIPAADILKMRPVNPLTKESVPVYEASFVSPEVGTGIVMSVPAHAPLDYLALRDIGKGNIPMPQVVSLKGYGPAPARELVEKMGVKSQDDPEAEKATKEIYTKEAHEGVMVVGKYKGQKAIEAKEKIAEDLKAMGKAFHIVTIANGPVYCRCGAHVVVNILKDQWFIDYGVPEWKAKAKECLERMRIIPADTRGEYLYTIDWFKTRPCTRAAGLGTKFPFDETKMIEALSDSTIYMAFYTVSHLLHDIQASEMDEAFFDAVFLGKGPRAKDKKLARLRDSFLYWYPVDSRHSAGDLIRNHLTLYIFNHVGIFDDKKLWPRQIVTNGFVLMDGTKMSKSMGNILPLRKAIKEYGADVTRFSMVCGADLTSDTDFNKSVAEGVRSRILLISKLVQDSEHKTSKPHGRIERWLLSRLNRKIERAEKMYEELAIRELALDIFYDVVSDLQWYAKRSSESNLHDFFHKWVVLIAPFMPHYAEEYWEMLDGKGFVSFQSFPKADHSKIDDSVERGEELIRKVHSDIEKISELIGKKPSKVTIYVAGEWKRELYSLAKANPSFEGLMKAAAAKKMDMKAVQSVAKQIMKNVHSITVPLSQKDELDALKDAEGFLAKEYSCKVEVLPEEQAKHDKAKSSLPDKPAIVIE